MIGYEIIEGSDLVSQDRFKVVIDRRYPCQTSRIWHHLPHHPFSVSDILSKHDHHVNNDAIE